MLLGDVDERSFKQGVAAAAGRSRGAAPVDLDSVCLAPRQLQVPRRCSVLLPRQHVIGGVTGGSSTSCRLWLCGARVAA